MTKTKKPDILHLNEVYDTMRERYGEECLSNTDTSLATSLKCISTGVFALDVATGGGIPLGCITEIYGNTASSKTTVASKIIATAQNTCKTCRDEFSFCKCKTKFGMKCVYFDVEGTINIKWLVNVGVTQPIDLVHPTYAEQAADMVELVLGAKETDLVVIDSLAQLPSKAELEQSAEQAQMGDRARIFNKAFRRWNSNLVDRSMDKTKRPTLIIINQVRQSMALYGDPEALPGGLGQKYNSSLMVRLQEKKYYFGDGRTQANNDLERPNWVEVAFFIKKSKVGYPRQSGSFKLFLNNYEGRKPGEVDDEDQLLAHAKKQAIITQDKGKWIAFNYEAKTQNELIDLILKDKIIYKTFRQKVLELMVK